MRMNGALELAEGREPTLVQIEDMELDGDETHRALFGDRDADGHARIFDDLLVHDVALQNALLNPPLKAAK